MTQPAPDTPKNPAPSRRNLLAGAGAAGAAAVAVSVLPLSKAPAAEAVAALAPPPEQGGGYQATPHVLQYYQTARV